MNSSISKGRIGTASNEEGMKLSSLERVLLLLPIAGGLVFGVFPFLLGGAFGRILGFSGDDGFIYRLAGAATFGYAVALIMGLRQGDWMPLRLVVIGTLAFNLASIYACVAQLVAGETHLIIYLILGTSVAITAITLWMLNRHKRWVQKSELSPWYVRFIALGTVLSGFFGLMPLFAPVLGSQLLGFHGTDVFLIRQAGAASLGYAMIGVLVVRSGGTWLEVRLPLVMALIFNGFSFIASVVALFSSEPVLITIVIGAASLFVTIVGMIAYQRKAQL